MSWTGDPLRDFDIHEARQEAALNKRPRCAYCDEPIQDEHCYVINDEPVCEECLNEHYRYLTEELVD